MTGLQWGSATDQGLVRRNNQDNLLVNGTVFAVADGMGGHAGGEVASAVAVQVLEREFPPAAGHSADDLIAAMHAANAAVFDRAGSQLELRGMGTTLTAAALVTVDGEERLAIANVGDSRAYVFAQGELTQLTEDHSVAEELVRLGQLAPDEVDSHPQRHILTRALGIQPDVEIDMWEVLPFAGDRILLCSDGLVREITDDQIAAVLRRLADPAEAAKELVAKARAAGGSDNITVVIIDVADDDDRALKASAAIEGALESHANESHANESHANESHANVPAQAGEPDPPDGTTPGEGEPGEGEPGEGQPSETQPGERQPGERQPGGTTPLGTALAGIGDIPVAPKRRRLTVRVVAFIILVLAILGGAAGAVVWYARDSYFVALGPPGSGATLAGPASNPAARQLLVYKGRPGGLLWFEPTLVERSQISTDEVLPSRIADLSGGKVVASLRAANVYIQNLFTEAAGAGSALTPASSPSTTTTTTTATSTAPTTTRPPTATTR